MRSLHLTGAPNTRDLGGLRTMDRHTVRSGMLLRSGKLEFLTQEDCDTLMSVPLHTVIDFRTVREMQEMPDTVIPGVEYVSCPILEEMSGITRETYKDEIPPYYRAAMAAGYEAEDRMTHLYLPLVEGDYSLAHYQEFLDRVLSHEGGALLYHCTAGKDRVGVATMLILSALGVDRETILEDYLLTNQYTAPELEAVVEKGRQYSSDPSLEYAIRAFDSARERYLRRAWQSIDERYGDVKTFLSERLDFGEEKQTALREKYLK